MSGDCTVVSKLVVSELWNLPVPGDSFLSQQMLSRNYGLTRGVLEMRVAGILGAI
jgi:hypothetical protein